MWSLRRSFGPYPWTRTSHAFYGVLRQLLQRGGRVLEFGSSTGHISFRLARGGNAVTLLDVRPEVIDEARRRFAEAGVSGTFVVEDFLEHVGRYDLVWNSGLIQCLPPDRRPDFLRHAALLSPRVLLFYPDTDPAGGKVVGSDPGEVPGVGNALEYPVHDLPERFAEHFEKVHWGVLPGGTLQLPFDMHWLLGENPCVSA